MKRDCSLSEISDGRFYDLNDMVKASCNGCNGLASCCHGMGNSAILDPYDVFLLTTNLKLSLQQLLIDKIELNIVDGIILPNLKMAGENEACSFLDIDGKCSIHSFRPGFCRIFPLGRYYENRSFQYILQVNECMNNNKTKVKVKKWIDTFDMQNHEQFVVDWHYFLKDIENSILITEDEKAIKDINMYLLSHFYMDPYELKSDFYTQFQKRLIDAKSALSI